MYTLIDFLSHVKGIEYILSVLFIAGFILYIEVLKPRPFKTLLHSSKDDLTFIKESGYRNTMKTVGRLLAAPFIGLFYVISLPFIFFFALTIEVVNLMLKGLGGALGLVGKNVSFGWRPQEAYFAGKKKKKEKAEKTDRDNEENE